MPESSTSLARARRPGLPAVVCSRHRTSATSFVAVAALVGTLASGLLLPIAVLAVTASASVLGVVGVAVGTAPIRSAWSARSVRRARRSRRDARRRRLPPASIGHATLAELTHLIDEIALRDPDLGQRIDLEALLDRHVDLTVGYEQALRAIQMTDRSHLVRIRNAYRLDPSVHARRLELCERRLRCHDECQARAAWYADQLVVLGDTVRLIAQHVTCPEQPEPDDLIERQLAALDDREAAYRQLAAELH